MKLLLALLLCSSSVFAAECNYEGSTIEMNQCARQDFERADTALNETYQRARSRMSMAEKDHLRSEQREWIRRRDAICKPKLRAEGTTRTIDYWDCMTVKTELRTMQLSALVNRMHRF